MKEVYYKLDQDRQPVPCSMSEWSRWRAGRYGKCGKDNPSRVAETDVGPWWVSTVFIGINMGFVPPLLYETMIFPSGDYDDEYCERCATWDEAVQMHRRAVARAKTMVAPPCLS